MPDTRFIKAGRNPFTWLLNFGGKQTAAWKRSDMLMTATPTSPKQILSSRPIRVGIVGAGYIADFHALGITRAKGVELAAVCDANLGRARALANKWRVPGVFDSLESMMAGQRLDAIHILAPPDLHYSLSKAALEAGVHVFLEKPMCTSFDEADDLCALARRNGLELGIGHNMLFSGAHRRLRDLVHSGALGAINHLIVNHFVELAPIRFGPFDLWMVRSPGNPFLEIGPHLISAVMDLVGPLDDLVATADRKVELPSGTPVFRRWRIRGKADGAVVDVNINFGPGFSQRTVNVHGLLGSATANFDSNICTFDKRTPAGIDLDAYQRARALSSQIKSQARQTVTDYVLSKLKLRRRGNAYQATFVDSIGAYYSALRGEAPLDPRIDGTSGRDVVGCCNDIIRAAGIDSGATVKPRVRKKPATRPTVLVLGGTGFIGHELIGQLLAANYCVRAAVRHSSTILDTIESDRLEIVRGDAGSAIDLKAMMDGIEFVYHLALDQGAKSWDDHVRRNVEPTRVVGEACLAAGVKRLVFTGTIDSYYAGSGAGTISEDTPLDRNIRRRNYYARAKAAAEDILMDMRRSKNLPVVIFRPGIVIGRGGNPFHFGVGRWVEEGICEPWGEGRNMLPFVLVEDVAAALVSGIRVPGIEGQSFNLIDDPVMNARDYLDELQKRAKLAVNVIYRPIWRFYLNDLFKWMVKVAVGHPDRIRIPSYRDWESRTQKARFDNARARRVLGWKPASDRQRMLEQGVGGSLQSWLAATE